MKLFKYYNQEILHLMLMIMISFLMIMVSVAFVRYLSMAASGEMPLKNAVALLGVILPNFVSLLLPISLFLAIVVGMNRLLHDNELLIGFACGMSFLKLIYTVFRMAIPIALIGLLLTYVIVPKLNDYQDRLSEIASQNNSALNFLQSGRFFALGPNQIIYVSNIDFKTRNSQNIFIYQNTGEATQIVLSPSGSVNSDGNSIASATLSNGQEYEISNAPNSLAVRMATFDHLVMTLIPSYNFSNKDLTAVNSLQLLKTHDLQSMIEFEWRSTLPVATLVLALLGVVLNDLQPRTSKMIKIFYALMIFIIYFNLTSVAKSLMLAGRLPLFPGLFTVHFTFLLLGLILLAYRERWFNLIYRLKKHEKT